MPGTHPASVANLTPGAPGRKFDYDAIAERLKDGTPVDRIMTEFGCSEKTVDRARRAAGLPPQFSVRPYTEEEKQRAIALLEDGTPYSEVARTLGRDPSRLAQKFPGYGVSGGDRFAVARMMRDFERLLRARGIDSD